MIIYILKHSNSDFSGTLCGVGFDKGRGSTSSTFDRDRCIKAGCKDISQQIRASGMAKEKKADLKAKKAEEKAMVEAEKKAEKKEEEADEEEEPKEEKAEESEKEKE